MKDSTKIIIAVIVSLAVLTLIYLIGNAANTQIERTYKLQTNCQQIGGYWDSYRNVCGTNTKSE